MIEEFYTLKMSPRGLKQHAMHYCYCFSKRKKQNKKTTTKIQGRVIYKNLNRQNLDFILNTAKNEVSKQYQSIIRYQKFVSFCIKTVQM